MNSDKRKTKLCKFYAQNYCKYGANCAYAHGTNELRNYTYKQTNQTQHQLDLLEEYHKNWLKLSNQDLLDQMTSQDLTLNMIHWDKEDRDYAFIGQVIDDGSYLDKDLSNDSEEEQKEILDEQSPLFKHLLENTKAQFDKWSILQEALDGSFSQTKHSTFHTDPTLKKLENLFVQTTLTSANDQKNKKTLIKIITVLLYQEKCSKDQIIECLIETMGWMFNVKCPKNQAVSMIEDLTQQREYYKASQASPQNISLSQSEQSVMACAVCGTTKAFKCGKCYKVAYCSKEHQKLDWPAHKIHCEESFLYAVVEWVDARKEHWYHLLGVFLTLQAAKSYQQKAQEICMKKGCYKQIKDTKPVKTEQEIRIEVGPYDYEEEWLVFTIQKIPCYFQPKDGQQCYLLTSVCWGAPWGSNTVEIQTAFQSIDDANKLSAAKGQKVVSRQEIAKSRHEKLFTVEKCVINEEVYPKYEVMF